ncbi:MAG: hypothetical protein H7343_06005 [Undibacterium sp.]|nr:hypothetical protein [Opitutaceae bacterium]
MKMTLPLRLALLSAGVSSSLSPAAAQTAPAASRSPGADPAEERVDGKNCRRVGRRAI